MSWLTNLIGSGAGIIAIVAGVLILRHVSHVPGMLHPWLHRGVIVLMFAGGAALAATTLGNLADSLIVRVAGWFGGLGYGWPHVIVVAAILVLLLGVLVGLIDSPGADVAMVAVALPLLLALPLGGLIHTVYTAVDGPAVQLTTALNHFLAG